jgi:hypothetical protein
VAWATLAISTERDLGLAMASGVILPPVISRAGARTAEWLIEFFYRPHPQSPVRGALKPAGNSYFTFMAQVDLIARATQVVPGPARLSSAGIGTSWLRSMRYLAIQFTLGFKAIVSPS